MTEIGKPQREWEMEPLVEPVPSREQPSPVHNPAPPPRAPLPVRQPVPAGCYLDDVVQGAPWPSPYA